MSRKNTLEEQKLAIIKSRERSNIYKQKIKERIRLSNENEAKGLVADPWVIEYRTKNNLIKANWKKKQPQKKYKPKTANSGSFKKGMIPFNKHSPEQQKESIKKWRENTKKWHQENKERVNESARLRKQNNLSNKLKANLRKRLSTLLRMSIVRKTEQTLDLLGLSMPEFMTYLESKFTEGMSFENYGKWHLDHIIPCYHFDLTKIQDRKKCFHYSNIQPMWAIDNLKKNKRLE